MPHLVNTLRLEMNCTAEALALRMRQEFATAQQQVQDCIDNVCTSFAGEDTVIRINRMEIDLGSIDAETFSRDFAGLFRQQLETQLARQVAAHVESGQDNTQAYNKLELLQFFLLRGYLPWWASASINFDLLVQEVLDKQPDAFRYFLMRRLTVTPLWQRMAAQFSPQALTKVVTLFAPLTLRREQWRQDRLTLEEAVAKNQYAPTIFALLAAFDTMVDESIVSLTPRLAAGGSEQIHLPGQALLRFAQTALAGNPDAASVTMVLEQAMGALPIIINDTGMGEAIISPPDPAGKSGAMQEQDNITPMQTDETEDTTVKFNTAHAGLVLLTPFLKTLFKALGLRNEKEWVSKDAQVKAVQVLYYAVTGDTLCREFDVVLEKIVCGMAIAGVVPAKVELTDAERDEVDQLLKAVISNWAVLHNTSPAGLRETFLRRQGVLVMKEAGWQLHVERKTVDVLVDQVPWTISMIHLPWNNYLIHTQW